MFHLGLISFAAAMLAILIALILTVFQLFKHQTALTKPITTLASVSFGLHTLSLLTLMAMQVLQDYSISYVVSVVNSAMPTILKMTAVWGGRPGHSFSGVGPSIWFSLSRSMSADKFRIAGLFCSLL